MPVAEAAVVGRFAKNHGQRFASSLQQAMRLGDKRRADTFILRLWRDRERCQCDRIKITVLPLDAQPGEQDVADDVAVPFCGQFENVVATRYQPVDETCLVIPTERRLLDLMDGGAVFIT